MNNEHLGLRDALIAYILWGSFGLYFHFLMNIPSLEVLTHRIVWCLAFVIVLLLANRRLKEVIEQLANLRLVFWLFVSSATISANWGLYIWTVAQQHITEASLGYYLAPLINLAIGVLFFKEKLNGAQKLALLLAAIGVAYQVIIYGQVPWMSLILALLFTAYNFIRKQVVVDPLAGLFIESLLMTPISLATLWWLNIHGGTHFSEAPLLLVFSGVMTSIPLLFFASAARKLPMSLMGFISYLSPSIQFITAVVFLGEPFDGTMAISFGFIWSALLVFSTSMIRSSYRLHHSRSAH